MKLTKEQEKAIAEIIKIEEEKEYEVEPLNCKAFIISGSITDSFEWKHDLPRNQK